MQHLPLVSTTVRRLIALSLPRRAPRTRGNLLRWLLAAEPLLLLIITPVCPTRGDQEVHPQHTMHACSGRVLGLLKVVRIMTTQPATMHVGPQDPLGRGVDHDVSSHFSVRTE